MTKQVMRPVGLTKDVGFQIGARRTLPVPLGRVWRYLISAEGQKLWLGTQTPLGWAPSESYRLEDGTTGELRVFRQESHLRITWQPPGWTRPSTIQVRVLAKDNRSIVAFHQEHLPSADAREARRAHFARVLDELSSILVSDT